MKKIIVIMFMVVFTFFNLCGYSFSVSPSDLKKLIVKKYKEYDIYLVERVDLVDVSKIEIGPARIEETCITLRDFGTHCEEQLVQSYEATITVNCVDRATNKIDGKTQENISGKIWKDNMGRLQCTGYSTLFCNKYQYGCAAGNCVSGRFKCRQVGAV